jgi:ATP-dependent DNA ligase
MNLPISTDLVPMEAKVQEQLPSGPGWQFEPKWDGFRAVAYRDGDDVYIASRNQRPLTRYFPELVPAMRAIAPKRVVLDAEIVIFAGVGMDFDLLQLRLHPAASRVNMLAGETPASLVVFDLLAEGDDDLRELPLRERRKRLERLLKNAPPPVYLSPVTQDIPVAQSWLDRYDGSGLDGIVAKRLDQSYKPGERAMVKVKKHRTVDCVVGGFRWSSSGKSSVGSLLLGLYRDNIFQFAGHTSGFDAQERKDLVKLLTPLMNHESFGEGRAPGGPSRWSTERTLEWESVRPELVCEVAFDRVINGRFRHGVGFIRWRPDKDPSQCTFDQIESEAGSQLTELLTVSR